MPPPRPHGPERLYFDSRALPAERRFADYCEINRGGAVATRTGPDFLAVIERWQLERAVLHVRRLNDVAHAHEPGPDWNGFDHFVLTLVRTGGYDIDVGEGRRTVAPGGVILLDMTRSWRTWSSDAHLVTVSLARDLAAAAAENVSDLHGRVVEAQDASLLADFLLSLCNRVSTLSPPARLAVTQALAGLLVLSMEQDAGIWSAGDLSREASVRRVIEQRMADPAFGPEALVRESPVSRATLYRIMGAHGGLAAYIRKQRLERVRTALADPDDTRSFAAISRASGFPAESQCSRAFKAAFGLRPGQYRTRALARGGDAESTVERWRAGLR